MASSAARSRSPRCGGAQSSGNKLRDPDGCHVFDSELALLLLKQWSWGHKSAHQVQLESQAAYQDQVNLLTRLGLSIEYASESLRRMGSVGSHGKHEQNCKRDLVRLLGKPSFPEPYVGPVPQLILKPRPGDAQVQEAPFPINDIHELFSLLWHKHPQEFAVNFLGGGGRENLEQFWAGVVERRDPRLTDHPMLRKPGWQRSAVPIMVHGDAVPVVAVGKAGTRSLDVFSFQGVLAHGSSLSVKHLVYSIFEQNKDTGPEDATLHTIWQRVLWSLTYSFLGEFPSKDHSGVDYRPSSPEARKGGQPLAEGLFVVVWLIKGDLEHLANGFGLRHFGAHEPCELCTANRSVESFERNVFNFRSNARWMKECYNSTIWKANNPHPWYLFELGYLSCLNVEPDELHIIYLGTAAYLAGSILKLLAYTVLPGTPVENMKEVWGMIVEYYKTRQTQCQFTNLGLSSFCEVSRPHQHYPKLKGKGAEIKDIMPALLAVWEALKRRRNEHDDRVQRVLEFQVELQSILSDNAASNFLPKRAADRLKTITMKHLQEYSILATEADARGDLLFTVAPKHHWMWHLSDRAKYINPRRSNTFIDEDFVGKIKEVAKSVVHGTESHMIPLALFEKFSWGKHVLWKYGA